MDKEKIYEHFKLSKFCDEERAIAVIDFLSLNGEKDTIEETDNYFRINSRIVKNGDTPEDYKKVIRIFKTLLSKLDV